MSIQSLFFNEEFVGRHIGTSAAEQASMLADLGLNSMAEFVAKTVPDSVLMPQPFGLPDSMTEADALAKLKAMASKNKIFKSYIGMGYYPTRLPNVIARNVLENPGWYTAYTPYQAEVSQGRLEALLNFQQVCIDLSGLEVSGASLLDEATAAAEAMAMAKRVSRSKSNQFFVDNRVLPQTLAVMQTRAKYFEFDLVIGDLAQAAEGDYFGALFQYVGVDGDVVDLTDVIAAVKSKGALACVAADIMSLVLLKSPGAMGADVALGNTQRFGVPMGFGGPHAAYFAFKDSMKRSAPGRLIGVSIDANGKPALRMALQTREQHIRREKANSNICTSQVLLANLAGMYAVYHGPEGVKRIANRIHNLASAFANTVTAAGGKVVHNALFDTVQVDLGAKAADVYAAALAAGYNLRQVSDSVLAVAFHEESSLEELNQLTQLFVGKDAIIDQVETRLPEAVLRTDAILSHPVFNSYHTEHEMLRYLKRLENKDIALNFSMISLGSCTMKLNATAEMLPITWPEFSNMHPFAPKDQTEGYMGMLDGLAEQLKTITGFDAMSLQPNSGAQGEYAGLVVIRRYHESRGEGHRDVCLIPRSAHGTNPASAQMAGMKVVIVACDDLGNVDVEDLKAKAIQHAANLGALMITYPSTHGVFEASIREICHIIHENGGQVYMDGANMNAQVGIMQPAEVGADVLHMNLHKTFCIPHGGGGPGMGPIGMQAHLAPFMASNIVAPIDGLDAEFGAISAAPYGSASILPITWMYITMMGKGLRQATEAALLHANYIAHHLKDDYPVLYTGQNDKVAHECIIDIRPLKEETGITEVDIAKRLMDFGFHAPTMSFPVAGTLMIEPTESESQAEIDRFIAAMKQIKKEVLKVQAGEWPLEDNPLVHAPHTHANVISDEWTHVYSRAEAVYPLPFVAANKYWPTVNRVDDVYGDRNLMCSCPSPSEYED